METVKYYKMCKSEILKNGKNKINVSYFRRQ